MKKICVLILALIAITALLCGCQRPGDEDLLTCYHTNTEIVGVVPVTCSTEGYTGYTRCLDCGEVIKPGKKIDIVPHKVIVEGEVPATCLTGGKSGVGTCEVCKTVVYENTDVPATGHIPILINVVKATCTANGYTGDEVCKFCDIVISEGSVTTATHNLVTTEFKESTCTTAGETGMTYCVDCGEVLQESETLPKTSHNIQYQNMKDATCTQDGYTGDQYCIDCQQLIKKGEVKSAYGHSLKTINAKANCMSDGYTGDQYCVNCRTTITKGKVTPAKGEHGPLTWINQVPATYDKGGYSGDHRCDTCGAITHVGHATDPLPKLPEYTCLTDAETQIFNEINAARAENGLSALKLDDFLHTAAYNRVREYIYCDIQGNAQVPVHARPDGSGYDEAIKELGINYSYTGEIIIGGGISGMVAGWMSSTEGHREAILDAKYTHMSVCIVNNGDTNYAVVLFHNGKKIAVT